MEPTVAVIGLNELAPHPANVRDRYDGNEMKQLAASVAEHGILHPLLVRPVTQQTVDGKWEVDHYQVVAGHRRLRAAQTSGLDTAPVVIRELDDVEALQVMLVENLQRSDLTPVEEARGYLRLTDTGMKVKELASKIGRSQKHVSGRLKLLSSPSWLLDLLHEGKTSLVEAETYVEMSADIMKMCSDVVADPTPEEASAVDEKVAAAYEQGSRVAARMLRATLEQIRRDRAIAEAEQAASAANITFLRMEAGSYRTKWPAGVAPLADLNVKPKDHRGEPCHAVGVDVTVDPPKKVDLCSSRSRHTKSGSSKVKPADLDEKVARREKDKEEKQARAAAHDRWIARVRTTVLEAKPTLLRDLSTLALARQPFRSDVDDVVARILGLEGDPTFPVIQEYAKESSAHTARVAACYAIVTTWNGFGHQADVFDYAQALIDDIAGPDVEQPPG